MKKLSSLWSRFAASNRLAPAAPCPRHLLEALYLGFGEPAFKARLQDLARLPGDELGQGGGGEVHLGSDPWSQDVVTKLTVAPQLLASNERRRHSR